MFTVNWQFDEFPAASVAVTVTVVVPTTNSVPDACDVVTVIPPEQLSDTVSGKFTTLEHAPAAAAIVIVDGHVICGAVWSETVTLTTHVVVFPDASVAVSVTACIPSPAAAPAAGLCVIVAVPQLSVATADATRFGIVP